MQETGDSCSIIIYLQDYYAGFAVETVVPAYFIDGEDSFDIALAGIIALLIVLFVGSISFLVFCCCLKHWIISIPNDIRRKDGLIKKQIVEDLNTTENPLWIEQKLKLYEEQELTMQVFSEPESQQPTEDANVSDRRNSFDTTNTYATIQPRHNNYDGEDYATLGNIPSASVSGVKTLFFLFCTNKGLVII